LFPLFEAEYGVIIDSTPIRNRVPVQEYLKLQKRFAHLFGQSADTIRLRAIQAIADSNIERFGLVQR